MVWSQVIFKTGGDVILAKKLILLSPPPLRMLPLEFWNADLTQKTILLGLAGDGKV